MFRSLLIKYGESNNHLSLSISLCSHRQDWWKQKLLFSKFYGVSGVEIAVRWQSESLCAPASDVYLPIDSHLFAPLGKAVLMENSITSQCGRWYLSQVLG